MGEVCTFVLLIHNIIVLQRPKRHLVAIVVKPTCEGLVINSIMMYAWLAVVV